MGALRRDEIGEEPMTSVAAVSGRTADQILARQRAAFVRDAPPSLRERRADLKKLRAAILARRAATERALDVDFGRQWSCHARKMVSRFFVK